MTKGCRNGGHRQLFSILIYSYIVLFSTCIEANLQTHYGYGWEDTKCWKFQQYHDCHLLIDRQTLSSPRRFIGKIRGGSVQETSKNQITKESVTAVTSYYTNLFKLFLSHIIFPGIMLPSFIVMAREAIIHQSCVPPSSARKIQVLTPSLISHFCTMTIAYTLDRWNDIPSPSSSTDYVGANDDASCFSRSSLQLSLGLAMLGFISTCSIQSIAGFGWTMVCLVVYPFSKRMFPFGKYICILFAFIGTTVLDVTTLLTERERSSLDNHILLCSFESLWPILLLWLPACVVSSAATCDIKDINDDQKNGIITLPTAVGPVRTRWISFGLCLTAAIIIACVSFPSSSLERNASAHSLTLLSGAIMAVLQGLGYISDGRDPNQMDIVFVIPLVCAIIQHLFSHKTF